MHEHDCNIKEEIYPVPLITLTDFLHLYRFTPPLLIDIRQPSEAFIDGFIPGSFNIPMDKVDYALDLPNKYFREEFKFTKPPVNRDIILYCKTGKRSLIASKVFLKYGYKNVRVFEGGVMKYRDTSFKVDNQP